MVIDFFRGRGHARVSSSRRRSSCVFGAARAIGLFLAFAAAFVLLALNQALAAFLGAGDELTPFTYVLRVLGFVLILYAIVDKNVSIAAASGSRPIRNCP